MRTSGSGVATSHPGPEVLPRAVWGVSCADGVPPPVRPPDRSGARRDGEQHRDRGASAGALPERENAARVVGPVAHQPERELTLPFLCGRVVREAAAIVA